MATTLNYNKYNHEDCITSYTKYVISLLKDIVLKNSLKKIVNFEKNNFILDKKHINIHINFEHTLVKKGGRSVDYNCEESEIKYNNIDNYLIRLTDNNIWEISDIVIDYSIPNIINVNFSKNNTVKNKQVYIPPILFNPDIYSSERNIEILTTFLDCNQPRRKNFLNILQNLNLKNININNCFSLEDNKKLLKNTKILINIHQTDHHDTFEELRCLPALLCGVIVVSENSPLYESIPYKDFIIWTSYENIPSKIIEISNNYDEYYNKIFNNNFEILIENMKNKCILDLQNKLIVCDSQ
jgi:hypothetical protein